MKRILFILIASVFFMGCKQEVKQETIEENVSRETFFNYQRFLFDAENTTNENELNELKNKYCKTFSMENVNCYITYKEENYISYMVGDICFTTTQENELTKLIPENEIITLKNVQVSINNIKHHKVTDGRIIVDSYDVTINGYDL